MSIRTIGIVAACLGLSVSSAFAQQEGDEPAAAEDWGMTVIELGYADAEEVAALLAEILPPGVSVTPYYQTNSLIVSGDRALVESLTRGGDDSAGNRDTDTDTDASDRGEPVEEGELTARL